MGLFLMNVVKGTVGLFLMFPKILKIKVVMIANTIKYTEHTTPPSIY